MSYQVRCTICNITIPEVYGISHLNDQTHADNASQAITRYRKVSHNGQHLGIPLLRVYTYREYTNFLPLYIWREEEVDQALNSLMAYRSVAFAKVEVTWPILTLVIRMGGPLGFDLEWESEGGVPRRVALVQLSTIHVIVLIHVSAMRGVCRRSVDNITANHIL